MVDFSRRQDDGALSSPYRPTLSRTSTHPNNRSSSSHSTISISSPIQQNGYLDHNRTASPRHGVSFLASSPMSVGMGIRTRSENGYETVHGFADGWDEVDKLGYQYSLRVAYVALLSSRSTTKTKS